MGLGNLATITRDLIDHGRDPRTPAAVIERGTTEAQRTVTATLGTLAAAAARACIESPAIAVIGDVVAVRARPGRPSLVSRVRDPLAFGRRCIPAGCVAHRSDIPDILGLRALPSGRIAGLGAQRISDSGH